MNEGAPLWERKAELAEAGAQENHSVYWCLYALCYLWPYSLMQMVQLYSLE